MKKTFLTLALGCLVSGIFTPDAHAQIPSIQPPTTPPLFPWDFIYRAYLFNEDLDAELGKYWPETTDPALARQLDEDALLSDYYPESPIPILGGVYPMFEGCDYKLRIRLFNPVPKDSVMYGVFKCDLTQPYHLDLLKYIDGLPDSVLFTPGEYYFEYPFTIKNIPDSLSGRSGAFIAVTGNGTPQEKGTGDKPNFLKRFTYNVVYEKPTVHHKGKLELNVKGASKKILRSLDGGISWQPDSVPIRYEEILNLEDVGVIYLKEPFSCLLETIKLNDQSGGVSIMRPIYMPKVEDAIISHSQDQTHYVSSRTNFVFTITPTGSNSGMIPVVTTDRTQVPDSEGVLVEDNKDGSFKVTIIQVQNPIRLGFNFIMDNESLEGNKVWANDGQLNVSSLANGQATIYNAAGSLIKAISVKAGETIQTPLPTGFYAVTLSGKTHKVMVK